MVDLATRPPATARGAARPRERQASGAPGVLDILRDEIIALTLAPGTMMSRADLQARFGLSSTPIRDALIRLQEEGLVDIYPQHATVVSQIDIGLAHQAQFLRRSVELEIMQVLARRPEMVPAEQLRGLIRLQGAYAELGEFAAFTKADQDFHRLLYEAANVGELWHVVRRQSGHIDRLRRLNLPVEGKAKDIIRAHTAILEALLSGSPADATAALRDHLASSLQFADNLKARHPGYFRAERRLRLRPLSPETAPPPAR